MKESTPTLDQLPGQIEQKANDIHVLRQVDIEELTEDSIKSLPQCLDDIKLSLTQIESDFLRIQNEWLVISNSLKKKFTEFILDKDRLIGQHAQIDSILQQAVEEKLNTKRKPLLISLKPLLMPFNRIKKHMKEFFQPRIGVLYQYRARYKQIPKRYVKQMCEGDAPLISIVTPSYNQSDFLERTILSVTRQGYSNLEYIIQDGGSTDDSVEIIKRYQSFLKHWASEKDKGQSHALNIGFQHATGDIMAYLNSDDVFLPGTLDYVAHYFQTHPEVDVVYGHRIVIDKYENEIGRWVLPPHDSHVLGYADYVPQETLFWRRRIWEKVEAKIDESFRFAMDWDLILRFQRAGALFARLPRFLGSFRVHAQQKTSTEMHKVGEKEMARIRLKWHGRYISHAEIQASLRWYKVKHLVWHHLYKLGVFRY